MSKSLNDTHETKINSQDFNVLESKININIVCII